MKKVVSLIVGLAVALCVTVVAPPVAVAQEGLARLVPQDAVFFKTSVGFEELWANITGSNFWKRVTSLKVWDETGARAGLEDFAEQFSENMGFEASAKNIMSLLGKEVAIAVYAEAGETPKIRGYLLFRSNPKSVTEDVIKKLLDAIRKAAGEEVFKESVYKGTKITTLSSDEMPVEVELGFVGDIFALGIGNTSPQLKKIVDLAGGTGACLANNPNFKKVVAATKMTAGRYAGTFYADMQKVGQVFAAIDESKFPMQIQMMLSGMKQSFSMPLVVGGTGYVDRGLVMKLASLPVGDVPNKMIELSLGLLPAVGKNINYVPENTIGYLGANSMPDAEKLWPLLLEQWEKAGAMPAMNMVFGQIEGALGMKIAEDVIPWVGNEFAMLFTDVDTKPGFPYPKFALMLKIKDNAKAKAFVQKLSSVIKEFAETSGLQFKKSAYQGCNLSSLAIMLPMPMPISLTPCYGIVGDFLVIGSSEEHIKQMIDTSKGRGKGLAANPRFKALNIPAKTTTTGFCDWAKGMEVAKAVAAWVVQFTQAQPMGEKVKAVVENYVVPIANCLSALESVGVYQVNQENMSTATYIIRVKDLPAM